MPDGLFKDMLLDCVVEGVGMVAVFLPNILILFLCITLFEDSGCMVRVAFLMDKIMVQEHQAALKRRVQADQVANSLLGLLGRAIAPVFAPIGIDWRGGIALLSGFVAKEIVVSTLGVLHAVTDDQGANALKYALLSSAMTPLSALSMMVFVLLYLPCLATVRRFGGRPVLIIICS